MRRMRWATYLWPGLPQLWVRGSWAALAVAVAAAVLLNLALLGSFGWSELIAPDVRRGLWVILGVVWGAAAVYSSAWNRRQETIQSPSQDRDAFGDTVGHYLKGNWFQTERLLTGMLRRNPRDLDARLMLATLLRHTGRLEEAAGELDSLTRFEGAEKWEWEVQRERELLAEAGKTIDNQAEVTASPGSADPPVERMDAA